jgi:translation initiation factor 2 beta subunit (eIF-2beta)/eIF-5
MLNINGSDDMFYRYKMDSVSVNVVGKGKMIRTYINNIDKISSQINRSQDIIMKYLSYETNSITKDNWIGLDITGKKIQELIYKFINCYILCKQCGNPETEFNVNGTGKNALLEMHCTSCGNTSNIITNHKIVKFVINKF